jgi:uncharacterized FAD-dependent dehydrogenase
MKAYSAAAWFVPTLTEATPGDLSLVLPYRYLLAIIEMLEALDKLAPGIQLETHPALWSGS